MPLPPATSRKPVHTRKITCNGYQRDDGLWDIEGHLVDTKPFPIPNQDRGGQIEAGEPLHDMWVRLTVDDKLRIHHAEASIELSPFNRCAGATDTFQSLVGMQIAPGWNRKVRSLIGGVHGCTHINEMLGQMATVAIQSIYGVKQRENSLQDEEMKLAGAHRCYALPGQGSETK